MTYEENVRAILQSNFAETKDEIVELAVKCICNLADKPQSDDSAIQYSIGYQDGFLSGREHGKILEGTWIQHQVDETHTPVPVVECSCCHNRKLLDMSPIIFESVNRYCGWCGAKMTLGTDK
jgi:hypothetical protein